MGNFNSKPNRDGYDKISTLDREKQFVNTQNIMANMNKHGSFGLHNPTFVFLSDSKEREDELDTMSYDQPSKNKNPEYSTVYAAAYFDAKEDLTAQYKHIFQRHTGIRNLATLQFYMFTQHYTCDRTSLCTISCKNVLFTGSKHAEMHQFVLV